MKAGVNDAGSWDGGGQATMEAELAEARMVVQMVIQPQLPEPLGSGKLEWKMFEEKLYFLVRFPVFPVSNWTGNISRANLSHGMEDQPHTWQQKRPMDG